MCITLTTVCVQVRGTLFNELDDDKLHKVIDFAEFEEMFKLPGSGGVVMTNGNNEVDGLTSQPSKRFKKPETVSLLEHTRLRNIGEQHFFKHEVVSHIFCSRETSSHQDPQIRFILIFVLKIVRGLNLGLTVKLTFATS